MTKKKWSPGDPNNLSDKAKTVLEAHEPPILFRSRLFIMASLLIGLVGLIVSVSQGNGVWFSRCGGLIVALGVLSASKDIHDFITDDFTLNDEQFKKSVRFAVDDSIKNREPADEIVAFEDYVTLDNLMSYKDIVMPVLIKKWMKQQRKIDTWILFVGTLISSMATIY